MARIHSIHRGKAEPLAGTDRWSAIRKVVVDGPVEVGRLGIEGDTQMDTRHHGGPFKALCAYCTTYYDDWKALGLVMPLGAFGENIAIDGLRDEDVCVGDVYAIGGVVTARVTGPRVPCGNLSAHWGRSDFQLIVERERKTGFCLAMEQTGTMRAGDEFRLLKRPAPQWNLPAFWDAFSKRNNQEQKRMIAVTIPGIDPYWEKRAARPDPAVTVDG